jgi:hypothetical protein
MELGGRTVRQQALKFIKLTGESARLFAESVVKLFSAGHALGLRAALERRSKKA